MSNDDRPGLSPVQLALVFLTGVAVCAVFFALGFVVARNQRASTVSADSTVEQVPPPAPAPTPVNGPVGSTASEATSPAPATAEAPIVVRNNPASSGSGVSASSAGSAPASPSPGGETPLTKESKVAEGPTPSPRQPDLQLATAATLPKTPVGPKLTAAASGAAPVPNGKVVVQVSAVAVRSDAETLVNLLKSRGYPAFVVTPGEAGAGDKLFRVQVGPYKTDIEAGDVRKKLVADGFKPFVRHT